MQWQPLEPLAVLKPCTAQGIMKGIQYALSSHQQWRSSSVSGMSGLSLGLVHLEVAQAKLYLPHTYGFLYPEASQ